MGYGHARMMMIVNNAWFTSIVTGLISGVLVSEWYNYRTRTRDFVDGLYDLYMYVELVTQSLESFRRTKDISVVVNAVVFQEQGRLYPKLLAFKRQDDETREVIKHVMALCYDDLHYVVRVQFELDDQYVINKLSTLRKLKFSILEERNKYLS